jgi:O-acetylserine/cysteine efflux transporter
MRLFHIALALLIIMIWGFNFVMIKIGLLRIPPIFLVCCRFFLTSIPLVFFVKKPSIPFSKTLSYGLVMFSLQFALLFVGIDLGVSPGLASILLQVQVFFTILLSVIIFKEKLHKLQILGAVLACFGITLIGLNLGTEISLPGFLCVLGAAFAWGPGNILSKKIENVDILSLVAWSSLIAWPPLLLLSLLLEGPYAIYDSFRYIHWHSLGAVLYITYLSTLLGFYIWNRLIHHYSLSMVAPFSLLSPVVGILSSTLVLKESLQLWKVLAACFIIIGLCINLLGSRKLSQRKEDILELKKEEET